MRLTKTRIVDKAKKVDCILAQTYGSKRQGRLADPTSELILTILSQNTNDNNRDKAYATLRRRFPTWAAVGNAKVSEIARAIRVGGLATIKSKRIKNVLRQISSRSSDYELDFLEKMSDEEIWDYLLAFDGVGPKTVSCVLLFALGRKAMPVDTHVHRVGTRLGLIPKGYGADKAHRWFLDLDLPLDLYQLHLNMIQHGRSLCRARRPRCRECPLKGLCIYYREQSAGRQAQGKT